LPLPSNALISLYADKKGNNVIIVASYLAQLIKGSKDKDKDKDKKFIISTHHGLFYNVIVNELRGADKYLLTKNGEDYKLFHRILPNSLTMVSPLLLILEIIQN
jgi:hypothetical protein